MSDIWVKPGMYVQRRHTSLKNVTSGKIYRVITANPPDIISQAFYIWDDKNHLRESFIWKNNPLSCWEIVNTPQEFTPDKEYEDLYD